MIESGLYGEVKVNINKERSSLSEITYDGICLI